MLSSLLRRSLSGQVSSQARLMSGAVMHQHDMDELYRKHKQNPQQFSVQLLSVQYKIRKEKVLGILKLKEMEIQWESQQKKLAELAKKDGGTVVESDKTEKPTEEKGSMIVMLEEDKTDEDMDESSKSHLPRYVAVDPEVEYVAPAIVKAKRFIPKTSSAAPNIEPSETLSSPSTRPHRYMYMFTEIGKGLNEESRSVSVRDREGKLRKATAEERIAAELKFGGSDAIWRLRKKKLVI